MRRGVWKKEAPRRRTPVHCYSLYGYRKDDADGTDDLRRDNLPEWDLARAIRWALEKGADTLLIELAGVENRTATVHHVCHDHSCPGGCQ